MKREYGCGFAAFWFFRFAMIGISLASSGPMLTALAQQAPAPSSEASAITGRILGDDGRPLVNAKVSANEVDARGPNRISRTAAANDEGKFRLTKLPPGIYMVSASAEGYLSMTVNATERPAKPDDRYFRPGASVNITLKKGGVITGRVTNNEDQGVVAVQVSLEYVRSDFDRPVAAASVMYEGWTDDRGIYRIFGLVPGSYLVRAGGRGQQARGISAYDSDAPTYHPSATRETATEVRVRAGEEVTDIDIRYRGERGYTISGTISGDPDLHRLPYVWLTRVDSGLQAGAANARAEDQSLTFKIEGIPDGEYELRARRQGADEDDGAASSPRRVMIKSADLKGIELRLIRLSSLSGRVALAAGPAACQPQQRRRLMDVSLVAYRDGATEREPPQERPDQQGEFVLRELEAGRYRLAVRLYHEDWYLRAITLPGSAPVGQRPVPLIDVPRQGLTLLPGERTTELTVTLSEGAAHFSGVVVPAGEAARLATRFRVHLVPAETAAADDVLRYAATNAGKNGSFALRNLAPGRYWLLTQVVPDDDSLDLPPPPTAWDAAERLRLRREAEAGKVEIVLQACQRVTGYRLRYSPPLR
jgi:carboxypeptidase family protein